MSFKDDFIEALRSVKRDFFREYEYTDQERADKERKAQEEAAAAALPPEPQDYQPTPPPQTVTQGHLVFGDDDLPPTPPSDEAAFEAYRQASTIDDRAEEDDDDVVDAGIPGDTTPYRSYTPSASSGDSYGESPEVHRAFVDFEDNGVYGDDKTIISKNTIIRGAIQTDDSIRMLGQILGDIDCKSNIVVAGKVRGNTTAANAYIFDAQVDGDVRCDDVITVSNDAWVLGNIRAQQAEIDGKIKGNMEIRHMVSIGSSSSILGDISTDELEIKRGAFVNGQIMMYSPSRDVLDRFDSFGE